jgi:hypothetical protein
MSYLRLLAKVMVEDEVDRLRFAATVHATT